MRAAKRSRQVVAFLVVVGTSVLAPGNPASAEATCAPASVSGGEWRSFGHDLSNTRSQPLEDTITPAMAPFMVPKWTFSIAGAGGTGNFQSTPVIADGCVYAGTNQGWIFAMNADTGEVVWSTELESSPLLAGLSGGIFSLAVGDGRVYANVSKVGSPAAVALDQDTGDVLWATVVDTDADAYTNSSVALIEGMVFIGISGPENGPADRRHPGGFALLDRANGQIIKRTYVVSEADDARGLKGASLWGTPVYDPDTGYMYDGTGQPANKNREHNLSNAIIKVDADRARSTFGEIVGSYHGDWDERADVDFGGSPTLFTDSEGNKLVGALQKSGRYHAVFADTMQQAWWIRMSGPTALGNAGTAAFDGTSIYVAANARTSPAQSANPGNLYALNATNGAVRWSVPVASGADYHLISVAGGVVYMATTHGLLLGVDAATGLPAVVRPMGADVADACVNLSSGVAIARNTVFAVCDVGAIGGGWIIAYS